MASFTLTPVEKGILRCRHTGAFSPEEIQTLTRFLRDYLYIPLGGNRRGQLLKYRNLMITMLLGGLWHGAGWTFVVWGGLHGLFLMIDRGWRALRPPDPARSTRASAALACGANLRIGDSCNIEDLADSSGMSTSRLAPLAFGL